jgi:hypothetical protein
MYAIAPHRPYRKGARLSATTTAWNPGLYAGHYPGHYGFKELPEYEKGGTDSALATMAEDNPGAAMAVGGLTLGLAILGPFIIGPWAVKQFKPDWTYGKRFILAALVSTAIGIARKAADDKA